MFLNHITKAKSKDMSKHQPEHCPYADSCYPVSYHFDKRGAGNCAGLIHKSTNLDCIRQCIAWMDLDKNKLELFEHFMTPEEALDCNTDYIRHFKELDKARKHGDKNPSNV